MTPEELYGFNINDKVLLNQKIMEITESLDAPMTETQNLISFALHNILEGIIMNNSEMNDIQRMSHVGLVALLIKQNPDPRILGEIVPKMAMLLNIQLNKLKKKKGPMLVIPGSKRTH